MSLLQMEKISKTFGGVKALSEVHFSVDEGEIHALLGENGAGKSTLMNILTGVVQMDTGQIEFSGSQYPHPTIVQMEEAGIAFVHQELNVINDLTAFENIFLNKEIVGKIGLLNNKKMIQETKNLFLSLGVNINPMVMVEELKTSEKQLLEISRALYADAKLFILDEPTTALSGDEVEHLFGILRRLREKGKSFIFISHKMPEIFEIADRYTVLRNGEFISSGLIVDTTPHGIASDMVGKQYVDKNMYVQRKLGDDVIVIRNFCGHGFKDINLTIRKGEILAFTGLAGSGASELMQTMFGALPATVGHIAVHGQKIHGGITSFMSHGVAMLPSNRKENSVLPDLDILENLYIAEHTLSYKAQIIHKKAELERYDRLKYMLNIKAQDYTDSINSLSGGNQQKIFFGRWLNTEADVLLLDNPTQGVDVGAKNEIYRLILELATEGKTIIINTLEIPEIVKVSDRCVVFFEGKIQTVLEHEDINEHDVMLHSTNAVILRGRIHDKYSDEETR